MNSHLDSYKRTYGLRSALAGVGFGILFPVVATFVDLSTNRILITLINIWKLHINTPLIWIIDTAPFFLGLSAYLVGIRQANLQHSNDVLRLREQELRSIQSDFEQRIQEQTKDLIQNSENLEKRTIQLQTAGEIGNAAASLHNLDELLPQATRLISERFGFYHVGIFLLDPRGEYAVLRASNSPGGKRMLIRGHRLKVGEVGIVGYVTKANEARIALDVGSDAVFFANPDLPETRSEMALPLKAGGKILGALDIQSTAGNAFSDADITTLQILANQLATAIENASLFAENQASLEAAYRAYENISQVGWKNLLNEREKEGGFISIVEKDVLPTVGKTSPDLLKTIESGQIVLADKDITLHLPIKVRGNVIGAIRLEKQQGRKWSADDIAAATTLSEQLGTALDSARLYEETSRRAIREQTVSEITTKIRSTSDPQSMLTTAMDELKRALGTSDIKIQSYQALSADQPANPPGDSGKKPTKTAE